MRLFNPTLEFMCGWWLQPVESMLGVMDGAVLERLAKIMGYMKTAPGAKGGRKLKRREKMRMLAGDAVAPATPSAPGARRWADATYPGGSKRLISLLGSGCATPPCRPCNDAKPILARLVPRNTGRFDGDMMQLCELLLPSPRLWVFSPLLRGMSVKWPLSGVASRGCRVC